MEKVTVDKWKVDFWQFRHDNLMKWYQELRQLYFDETGISWVPADLEDDRIAPTENDKAWLLSIGIDVDKR
jgi:hypothetical protein